MATKRSRDVRDQEDTSSPKSKSDQQGEGILGSFKRLINNFLFPSYGVATAASTSGAESSAPALEPPPVKRRRLASPAPEDDDRHPQRKIHREEEDGRGQAGPARGMAYHPGEQEEDLSQLTVAELKQRGYSIDDIHRIFEGGSPSLPRSTSSPSISTSASMLAGNAGARYTTASFASPSSSSYANGTSSSSVPARRGTVFAAPPPPRGRAPVGTYTPSTSMVSPRRQVEQRWSPAQDLARARTGTASLSTSRTATPRPASRATPARARKTPTATHDLDMDGDTTSATAHRILATLGKIPSPLPNERMSDVRSLQKVLGKRHLDTPSSRPSNGGLPTKSRAQPAKPLPVAKRQRVDEDSYAASRPSRNVESFDEYSYREDDEEAEPEEEQEVPEELEEKVVEEPLIARREREERRTPTVAKEKEEPAPTLASPKKASTEKPQEVPAFDSSFVSPIMASESIFNYKVDAAVSNGATKDKDKDLASPKKDKESDHVTSAPLGFVVSANGEDKGTKGESTTVPSSSASIFGFGTESTVPATSVSIFSLQAQDEAKDESSASKTDFGFAWDNKQDKKEDIFSSAASPFGFKPDAFSGFSMPAAAPTTSATESASTASQGFSIPVLAKQDGWKCACCETSNSESDTTCAVCLVPRPAPKPTAAPSTEDTKKEEAKPLATFEAPLATTASETPKEAPASETSSIATAPISFGFAPIETKPKVEDTPKTESKADKKKSKKRKDEAPATDLFSIKSDFGSSTIPSFSTAPFSFSSTAPALSVAADSSSASAASSMFAPTTAPQKPFIFGAADNKEEPKDVTKPDTTSAPAFGFTATGFGTVSTSAKDEDSMADSLEPSGAAAVPATSFATGFAPSSTSTPVFPFSSPSTGASTLTTSAPAGGMFMFGASSAAPAASVSAPSLTASGSFPFAPSTSSVFSATPSTSSAFSAPAASVFSSAPVSSAFPTATASATSAFSAFGTSSSGDSAFSPAASVFGSAPSAAPPFGASAAPATSFASPFGQPQAATASTGSAFGLSSSGTFASPFGQTPAAAPSPFGQTPSAAAPSPFPFGASGGLTSSTDSGGAGGFTLGAAPAQQGGRKILQGRRRRGGQS